MVGLYSELLVPNKHACVSHQSVKVSWGLRLCCLIFLLEFVLPCAELLKFSTQSHSKILRGSMLSVVVRDLRQRVAPFHENIVHN